MGGDHLTGGVVRAVSLPSVSPSQLRMLRGGEQVAAVCYRVSERGIEFLLVKTRGGRWTFPKGSTEPGLTYAQAAALEAYEEAGVHGRMEEIAFARYIRRSSGSGEDHKSRAVAVHAHLCEVTRLDKPLESRRHPTWFTAEKAQQRLQAARTAADGYELTQVVERAVSRIKRLRYLTGTPVDSLQKVKFEVGPEPAAQVTRASYIRYVRRPTDDPTGTPIEVAVNAHLSKVLRFGPSQRNSTTPLLIAAGKTGPAVSNGKKKS